MNAPPTDDREVSPSPNGAPRAARSSAARSSSTRIQRLRVLRVLPELDFGGVESRLALQAELHDRGAIDLSVAAFHKHGAAAARIEALGVPVFMIGESPRVRNPRATLALARLLRRLRPHVAHASVVEANFHLLLASLASPRLRVMVEETGMPQHGLAARITFRALYRRADHVVGVSRAVCDYLERVDGAPRDRVKLIYNCASPSYFPDTRRPARGRAGERLRVLMVGRLVPVKNHEVVFEALARASARGLDAELTIAGDGPRRAELEALAARLGIADRVRFLGYRADVRDLVSETDLFVLSSISEGCSVSLVEAMATGVPVLGSTADGIAEVLGPLASTCALPTHDVEAWAAALEAAAAASSEARAALVQKLQARAYEHFAPTVYMRTLEDVYRGLARSGA
jgi:glycosyltransferase involved in cell wall biosynthesis